MAVQLNVEPLVEFGDDDMDQESINALPVSVFSFEAIRSKNRIYVDKTRFVYQLASGDNRIFLSRPRRFGKSLLVSTFESLFKNGLEHFNGLEIEGLWTDTTYPVVHIDFSEAGKIENFEDFAKECDDLIADAFEVVGFERSPTSSNSLIRQLSKWLKTQPGTSLVLLIDEYDAPLTQCLNRPELFEKVRDYLSGFYSIVKGNDARWRFVFITGIAKFAKMSIFFAMNNLEDISLESDFAAVLGITHQELERYFDPYLENASKVLGLSKAELVKKMTRKYDGFRFSSKVETQVFSPWSALRFLKKPQDGFLNYWYDSAGQPTVLLEYFKTHSFNNPKEYFAKKEIPLETLSLSSSVDYLDDKALMTQAGYLTIKEQRGAQLYVGYPNAEVRESIARLYAQRMLNRNGYAIVNSDEYKNILGKGKGENIFTMFNRLINNLSYNFFEGNVLEAQVVSMYQLFMIGSGLDPHVENVSAKGRSGLQVTIADRHLVIEFKVQREGKTAETKLLEAVNQIMENRYGEGSFAKEIFRLALVFSEKERRFVKWREVPVQED